MRYENGNKDYPDGYWINMRNITLDEDMGEELILFIGLEEEAAESIFNRLNLFLQNWLLHSGFIKDEDLHSSS